MNINDFDYDLPEELIAQYPVSQRSGSRLLQLNKNTGEMAHHLFADIVELLNPNDLLVVNDTRVIPARMYGAKSSGGKIEILVERAVNDHCCLAHIRANKAPKIGSQLLLTDKKLFTVSGRQDDLFELWTIGDQNLWSILEQYGHIPLPPYISRVDEPVDQERYQTVYAKHQGAVAAPTAGLHFDEPLLQRIKLKGISLATVTLHVGAGTFQPVREQDITKHKMHSEYMVVAPEVCSAVKITKQNGGRIIAVGTTSVRALETATASSEISPFSGMTEIFIYPSYQFKVVDGLITNFHLPKSTLLMLVSALTGFKNLMEAYQTAIANKYRFYSYGDAMFIT